MTDDILDQLRAICLTLPEAVEAGGVGNPSFKVRDKIFAMRHDLHQDQWSLWCKAAHGVQGMLVAAEPERYFVPPYVGQHGWIGIRLEGEIDWAMITDLVQKSYCITAPKRLVARLAAHP